MPETYAQQQPQTGSISTVGTCSTFVPETSDKVLGAKDVAESTNCKWMRRGRREPEGSEREITTYVSESVSEVYTRIFMCVCVCVGGHARSCRGLIECLYMTNSCWGLGCTLGKVENNEQWESAKHKRIHLYLPTAAWLVWTAKLYQCHALHTHMHKCSLICIHTHSMTYSCRGPIVQILYATVLSVIFFRSGAITE